jgi:hypothetical protein
LFRQLDSKCRRKGWWRTTNDRCHALHRLLSKRPQQHPTTSRHPATTPQALLIEVVEVAPAASRGAAACAIGAAVALGWLLGDTVVLGLRLGEWHVGEWHWGFRLSLLLGMWPAALLLAVLPWWVARSGAWACALERGARGRAPGSSAGGCRAAWPGPAQMLRLPGGGQRGSSGLTTIPLEEGLCPPTTPSPVCHLCKLEPPRPGPLKPPARCCSAGGWQRRGNRCSA